MRSLLHGVSTERTPKIHEFCSENLSLGDVISSLFKRHVNFEGVPVCSRIVVASPYCLLFVWCCTPENQKLERENDHVQRWHISNSTAHFFSFHVPCIHSVCRHEPLKFQYPDTFIALSYDQNLLSNCSHLFTGLFHPCSIFFA